MGEFASLGFLDVGSGQPVIFVLALMYALSGLRFNTPAHQVAFLYILCLAMQAIGSIGVGQSIIGCLIAAFLALEVFSLDEALLRLVSFPSKVLDWLFRMLFEFHVALFLIFASTLEWLTLQSMVSLDAAVGLVFLLSLVSLGSMVCRRLFSRKSFSEMLDRMWELAGDPALAAFPDADMKKVAMLLHLEDRGFFDRAEFCHSVSWRAFVKKAFEKTCGGGFSFGRLLCDGFPDLLFRLKAKIRGYSTIEMQLIRNIGLNHGSYRHVMRRKIFELLYSHLLFNGYIRSMDVRSPARSNVRAWMVRAYLGVASVRIDARVCRPGVQSTFFQTFGCEFHDLSEEQFLIWCMGLPHYESGVTTGVIERYRETIRLFSLDENLVRHIAFEVREGGLRGGDTAAL